MGYKVGDKVRVKSWDELLSLGELDRDGDIKLQQEDEFENLMYFLEYMQVLCGETGRVSRMEEEDSGLTFFLEFDKKFLDDDEDELYFGDLNFSPLMVEKISVNLFETEE